MRRRGIVADWDPFRKLSVDARQQDEGSELASELLAEGTISEMIRLVS